MLEFNVFLCDDIKIYWKYHKKYHQKTFQVHFIVYLFLLLLLIADSLKWKVIICNNFMSFMKWDCNCYY